MGSVVHIYIQVTGDETRACVCMYISACLCATYLCLSYFMNLIVYRNTYHIVAVLDHKALRQPDQQVNKMESGT